MKKYLKRFFVITIIAAAIGLIAFKFGISLGLKPYDPPQPDIHLNPFFFPLGNQMLNQIFVADADYANDALAALGFLAVVLYWYLLAILIYLTLNKAMKFFKRTKNTIHREA